MSISSKANFQPKQKPVKQGVDIKNAAQEKRAFQNKERQQAEMYAAWERYEISHDTSQLLPLLREKYSSQQPMPMNMSEMITYLSEKTHICKRWLSEKH